MVTYADAYALCAASDSHMLTITSSDKQHEIMHYIENIPRTYFWPFTSYSVLTRNGFWFNNFDAESDYSNWHLYQPSNGACTHISGVRKFSWFRSDRTQTFGKWFHSDCSAKMYAVCEKPFRSKKKYFNGAYICICINTFYLDMVI